MGANEGCGSGSLTDIGEGSFNSEFLTKNQIPVVGQLTLQGMIPVMFIVVIVYM